MLGVQTSVKELGEIRSARGVWVSSQPNQAFEIAFSVFLAYSVHQFSGKMSITTRDFWVMFCHIVLGTCQIRCSRYSSTTKRTKPIESSALVEKIFFSSFGRVSSNYEDEDGNIPASSKEFRLTVSVDRSWLPTIPASTSPKADPGDDFEVTA